MSRRAQPLTPAQKSIVANVRRISKQRARVNEAYVDAVISARESGVTYSAIAAAAGTSSQAAQEIVRRHRAARAKDNAVSENAEIHAGTAATAVTNQGDVELAAALPQAGSADPAK